MECKKVQLAKKESLKRIRSASRENEGSKKRRLEVTDSPTAELNSSQLAKAIIRTLSERRSDMVSQLTVLYCQWRTSLTENILHETIKSILACDILNMIVESFKLDEPMLNYEVLWAFTNLTALLRPDEIETLFLKEQSHPVVIRLIRFITCGQLPLACLSCWAIGNILADSGEMRTQFLRLDILDHIIKLAELDATADTEFISIQAWLIGNILRNNSPPVHHSVCVRALPRLLKLLRTDVVSIQSAIMRGLVSMTVYAERAEILMTLDGEIFIEILNRTTDPKLINATLTVVGNIIASSEVHTNFFLKRGLYNILKKFIDDKTHRSVVCLTLGNICTGKPNTFCFIITDELLMNKLIKYAVTSEWQTKQNALTGTRLFLKKSYILSSKKWTQKSKEI